MSARQDLQEVFDIANISEMRLYLTDYYLEMARLLLAEQAANAPLQHAGQNRLADAREHTRKAAEQIEATGYHRRDTELAELQQTLSP